jgi:hypothetical protein
MQMSCVPFTVSADLQMMQSCLQQSVLGFNWMFRIFVSNASDAVLLYQMSFKSVNG